MSTSLERNCDVIASLGCTQPVRVGRDTHATEVQAVRVPAGLDRDVCIEVACTVVTARAREQIEFVVGERKKPTVEFDRECSRLQPVMYVATVVDTTCVVEEREEFDDLGICTVALSDIEPVRSDPSPMGRTMNPAPIEQEGIVKVGDEFGGECSHGADPNCSAPLNER